MGLRHIAVALGEVVDWQADGGVGKSDSQQPTALGLSRLWWLRGIEMEQIF